ncbi:MAG TPA: AAA family ATPase [Gammaproteobacteria bacterium]|nr:AAA family ATPase [Gammaproteobacteria bacterium]
MSGIMDDAADSLASGIDILQTRDRFRAALDEEKSRGQTLPKIADRTGVAYATLHAWLSAKYNGDNAAVAKKVHAWLLTREARARTQATVRRAPGFLKTRTATQIFDVLEYAQTAPDMVIVSGGPGVGKTTAIRAYEAIGANVWVTTAEPAVSSVPGLLDMLMDALKLEPGYRGSTMSRRVRDKLLGSEGLLIVDEAQHLKPMLRDQLRATVHDAAGIGVALVGNEALSGQFARERATGQYAQLISRFGQRVNRAKPYKADAELLLDGWQIQGAEARETALGIAMQPGALRQMNKTLRIAFSLSDLRGDEEPTAHDIQAAWKQLGGLG